MWVPIVPLYDFRCTVCGDIRRNVMLKMDDLPIKHRCVECGTGKMVQLLQPPSIVYEGGGWTAGAGKDLRK